MEKLNRPVERPSVSKPKRDRSRIPALLLILIPLILASGPTGLPTSAHAGGGLSAFGRRCLQWLRHAEPTDFKPEDFSGAATNELRTGTHFPKNFSPEERTALLKEFMDDGRPILVVTDAHYGQKSGVVTVMKVLQEQVAKLTQGKVAIKYVMPDQFKTKIAVKYQDLIFAYMGAKNFKRILTEADPQAIHVMVEGNLGSQARSVLKQERIPFTTAYHTMFPEYIRDMVAKYSKWLSEPARKFVNGQLRNFHSISEGIMVPTETMAKGLIDGGYAPERIRYWSHGVDVDLFDPSKADPSLYAGLPRPISVFIGRVAVEKNLEDFLRMDIPGTKVVVGSGPELEAYRAKYPNAVFLGRKNYEDLPKYYASSDVFVFPSLTDTFGLVQLEANAAGVPVAAFKVQGPIDVITSPKSGVLADYKAGASQENVDALTRAWHEAIKIKKEDARSFAEEHTWEQSALEFLYFLRRLEPKK